jgi:predicted nucleotidyltransferase
MKESWAVTPQKINKAVRRIVRMASPRRVILFGSAAHRGGGQAPRDADLLVVSRRQVASPRRASVRLRRAIRGIMMPVDILVVSERRLRELADRPGLVYREALRRGKVVYEAA